MAGSKVRKVRDYQYEGLRYQSGGRGSLGFAKIIEKNSANNQTATTWYKQQYPFTGQVSKQTREVKDSTGANVLLYEMNVTDWLDNSYLSGQVREANAKTTQEQFFTFDGSSGNVSSTGTAHSTKVTTLTRDKTSSNYSTLGQKRVTTTDHHSDDILTVQTDNDFDDEDTSNWYIQRPTGITQTRTLTYATGGSNVKTQSDTLAYNTKARLLTKDRATVADDAYMRKAYGYDTAGNVTRATQCSQDYASNCDAMAVPTDTHTDKLKFFRRVITNYDSDNRYIASTSNGLFTTASMSAYNALGLPGTVVNEKGVTQSLFYDAFGRKYFTASTEEVISVRSSTLVQPQLVLIMPVITSLSRHQTQLIFKHTLTCRAVKWPTEHKVWRVLGRKWFARLIVRVS